MIANSRLKSLCIAALASLGLPAVSAVVHAAEPTLSYNRDIRPLLSESCFKCHGPDSGRRKLGMRLDQSESAMAAAKSGKIAIVPGNVDASELVRRITTSDADHLMPPPEEHKPLTPAEIELLKRWVKEGARYEGHWAYQKVLAPTVPKVDAAHGNPIDAFILARLAKEGLMPSPAEEKARLIRRVSLDLTGLPPTIEQVDAFVHDDSLAAYEKVVDRLLASPHFGERMAVPWLDLARYSDTAGYHNDSLRTMYLWRDWIVKSFNENKPFDQFTIEQLAGDLMPNATIDNKLASGFMRNVMTSDEGGIIPEEYLNLYIVDRVGTFGATWLGMTVKCAQCHDHKYDPVTQKDFYSMYAFFHNVPELGKDGVRDRNPGPVLMIPAPDQATKLANVEGEIKSIEQSVKGMDKALDTKQIAWEKQIAANPKLDEPKGPFVKLPLAVDGDGVSDEGEPIEGQLKGRGSFAAGKNANSFYADGAGWLDYGQQCNFDKDQPFSVATWVRVQAAGGSPLGKMDSTRDVRGWDIEFHGTKLSVHLIHSWPRQAIHVQAEKDLPADKLTHIAFSYDGSGKAAGLRIFVNGSAVKTNVLLDNLAGSMKTAAPFSIGRRGGLAAPFHGTIEDLRIYRRALSGMELAMLGGSKTVKIALIKPDQRSLQQKEQLRAFYRENVASDYGGAQRKLDTLRKEKLAMEKDTPNSMVMVEMDKPRDTFIKIRGQYDKDGEKVTANTPHFLPPLPDKPANGKRYTRLDLAQWLVTPEHPLTARVAINRYWATIFGTGLVKTVNDFGSQGEWPSHPELLDWLAADFMRDWNTKRAIKQMVMSGTYCQSSRITPELLERDSANRLLARGPRNRLEAEFIRDNALAISGLLNGDIGGKPIFPYQPPGIWEVNSGGTWRQEHDAGQYRRALYIYHRRSTPYPAMLTFDAPSREVCTAIRAESSTPLQSLALMNDPVMIEAARALAQRTIKESSADSATRLQYMWRLALARPMGSAEQAILEKTLAQQLEKYKHDAKDAAALTKVGDLPKPEKTDVEELAAWTAVASVILNLNETISN